MIFAAGQESVIRTERKCLVRGTGAGWGDQAAGFLLIQTEMLLQDPHCVETWMCGAISSQGLSRGRR